MTLKGINPKKCLTPVEEGPCRVPLRVCGKSLPRTAPFLQGKGRIIKKVLEWERITKIYLIAPTKSFNVDKISARVVFSSFLRLYKFYIYSCKEKF